MNDRQRVFAEAYASSGNATMAAKAAGYSEKTAYSQGQRLLKNVEVTQHIRKLQDASSQARLLSVVRVKGYLSDVITNTAERTSDRLRACDMLLKCAGEYLHERPDSVAPRATTPTTSAVDGWHDIVYYDPRTSQPEPTDDDGDGGTVIYLPIRDRLEDHEPDDTGDDQETGG